MLKVTKIHPAGTWTGPAADHVTLDQDGRHRRRIALTGDHGLAFLLDLPEAVQLRHGEALELEDGRVVEVLAAPEALLEVRGKGPDHLLQLAWHLGNRHLATQVAGDRLLIRYDHVIAHMLEHLGASVAKVTAPFDPEGGAYGGAHGDHDH
ncbi:MAG: urease accessory protein UreE [Caulobacter sp.]|nr:urease accessory protein UreE [Caulobacter sp.]